MGWDSHLHAPCTLYFLLPLPLLSHTLSITLTLSYVSPPLVFSHLLIICFRSDFPKHRLLLGTPQILLPSAAPSLLPIHSHLQTYSYTLLTRLTSLLRFSQCPPPPITLAFLLTSNAFPSPCMHLPLPLAPHLFPSLLTLCTLPNSIITLHHPC